MARLWSDENRFAKWLEVEIAASETLADAGIVPREAAAAIAQKSRIDTARIHEIEAQVRHDVIAFTVAVGESIGAPEQARWLHYGLSSNGVVETGEEVVLCGCCV